MSKYLEHDCRCRGAGYGDLEQIVNLDLESNVTYWSIGQYQEAIANKFQQVLVLERDDIIVALLVLSVVLDEAEILQLAVLPSCQGLGIATKFLSEQITDLVKNKGIKKITLEVRIDNKVAIGLYTKLGFETTGVRHGYYNIHGVKVDALIMQFLSVIPA